VETKGVEGVAPFESLTALREIEGAAHLREPLDEESLIEAIPLACALIDRR
jgi:hypothetical protein